MTVLTGSLKRGGILSPLAPSTGVSPDALVVQRIIHATWGSLAASLALRRTAETAIALLANAQMIASKPNWDGYGGLPADRRSVEQAMTFLRALPTTLPTPDVSVDPDGEIDVMWHLGGRRTLSVSVGPKGRLTYSALIDGTQSYGTEWFSNEIPQPILYNLSRVLDSSSR